MIDIDPTTLTVLATIVIPFVVSAATKSKAPARLKATLNLVLVGAAAFLANATTETGHAVFSWTSVRDWALGLVTSIGVYHGVLKPLGGNDLLWPDRGLGRAETSD